LQRRHLEVLSASRQNQRLPTGDEPAAAKYIDGRPNRVNIDRNIRLGTAKPPQSDPMLQSISEQILVHITPGKVGKMWDNQRQIRSTILSYPAVHDCFIAEKNANELVAYVVGDGSLNEVALAEFVRFRHRTAAQSLTVVTVASLPFLRDAADLELSGLAIHDSDLVNAWQLAVNGILGKGRVEVGIAAATENQGAIHVVNKVQPVARNNLSGIGNNQSVVSSFVDGGAVECGTTETMVTLLLRAADQYGHHAIVHVDAGGVEQVQTYQELATDACRLAKGLSLLGLAPGATVLLQLGSSQHFFTACGAACWVDMCQPWWPFRRTMPREFPG
jgi:hypothetical protein